MITGGLRVPRDFIKAMAVGADGIAMANSAMQSSGCIAARICHTNNCPAGIATQNPELRKRLDVEGSSKRLASFFDSSVELMKVMARACGHSHLNEFSHEDIATFNKQLSHLSGIEYSGINTEQNS
jgi:glutamate synthase domain-containing protein 2